MNWGIFRNHPKKIATSAVSGVLLIATPLVAQFEGVRTKAYLDVVSVPTICFGETLNVKLGDEKTEDECREMLAARLGYFAMGVDVMIIPDISDEEMAAYSSLAYNVGLGAFEKSTLLKKVNAGDRLGGCNELLKWNRAGGKVVQGLVRRREAERKLCLAGL